MRPINSKPEVFNIVESINIPDALKQGMDGIELFYKVIAEAPVAMRYELMPDEQLQELVIYLRELSPAP